MTAGTVMALSLASAPVRLKRTLVTGAGLPDAEGILSRLKTEESVEPGLASFAPGPGPILGTAGLLADR